MHVMFPPQLAGPGETPFVIAYAPSSVYTGGVTSPNAGVTLSAEQVGGPPALRADLDCCQAAS
jgi:hypothetical protein